MMFFILLIFQLISCNGQSISEKTTISEDYGVAPPVYYGMPAHIDSRDTSPSWNNGGPKILITGTIYHIDGKTPAPNVLIYYYQTDSTGRYTHKKNEIRSIPPNDLGQTHGHIRGWVKSNALGKYSIYTTQPGSYPSGSEASHIHIYIKEPDLKNHYYIDNFVFDNDPLLTSEKRNKMENRGGSGVLRFVKKDNLNIGERNIILGLNVTDHPNKRSLSISSGKAIGEDISSFTPYHAWGADKGTKTCPICKYGWYHGILFFVGNDPNWIEIKQWLKFLDQESQQRDKYLKVYFVYGNEREYNFENRNTKLEKLGMELNLKKVALTIVPSFSDKSSDIYRNNINPNVENTFLIYKRSNVIDKFINLSPAQENFDLMSNAIDNSVNEYYDLPRVGKKEIGY